MILLCVDNGSFYININNIPHCYKLHVNYMYTILYPTSCRSNAYDITFVIIGWGIYNYIKRLINYI